MAYQNFQDMTAALHRALRAIYEQGYQRGQIVKIETVHHTGAHFVYDEPGAPPRLQAGYPHYTAHIEMVFTPGELPSPVLALERTTPVVIIEEET